MPDGLPKLSKSSKRSMQPQCVDLKELFSDARFEPTLNRVLMFLLSVYVNNSDGSYERISREGVATEVFLLTSPTQAAYLAEIALCNAIHDHALGKINDENIKVYLGKYLETHTYVFIPERESISCKLKTGTSYERTSRDIPLVYVSYGIGTGATVNPVQKHLYTRLEALAGNNAEYTIVSL